MIILHLLGALTFYSIICCTAGMSILRFGLGSREKTSPGAWLATSFLLGQGILASIWLLLALAGWFRVELVLGIGGLTILSGGSLFWKTIIESGAQVKSIWKEYKSDSWGWRLIETLTLLLIIAGVTSLGRSMAYSDGTAFYIALSKVIASSHHLVPLPDYEPFTTVGLQGELHLAALMALGSSDAAKLFSWITIVIGAVMLLAIVRWTGSGRRGQWIALAMMFTSTGVLLLFGDGKVDLFGAALGLAAVYWAVRAQESKTHFNFMLTGLFVGFATVAKFSYLPLLIPAVGIVFIMGEAECLWGLIRRKDWLTLKNTCGKLALIVLEIGFWFCIAFLPHLIKNGLLFGAPFAPFGRTDLGKWDNQVWFSPETTRHILLTYPFAWTFGNYWAQYGNLTPLVLAFLPLAVFLPRPRSIFSSKVAVVTLAAAGGLLVWGVFRPSVLASRYVLAILLLFIPLAARAAENVVKKESRSRWLTASIQGLLLVVLVSVNLYGINSVFFPKLTARYLVGIASECERDGVFCDAMQTINWKAAPGARVFNVSWYRYWFRPDLLQCISNRSERELFTNSTPDERWLMLYQRGFKYLFTDRAVPELDLEHPPAWVKVQQLFKKDSFAAYYLDYNNLPEQKIIASCLQINPPAWQVVTP